MRSGLGCQLTRMSPGHFSTRPRRKKAFRKFLPIGGDLPCHRFRAAVPHAICRHLPRGCTWREKLSDLRSAQSSECVWDIINGQLELLQSTDSRADLRRAEAIFGETRILSISKKYRRAACKRHCEVTYRIAINGRKLEDIVRDFIRTAI